MSEPVSVDELLVEDDINKIADRQPMLQQALDELGDGKKSEMNDEENELKENEQEEKQQDELKEEIIMLQLGDVIHIQSPENERLNDGTFLIDYIDRTKIVIINVNSFDKHTILTDDEGHVTDQTIQIITIISSNPEKGYARQNNLIVGNWVNIYFKMKIPFILTASITNLEDDMIELKIVSEYMKNETIYINFNYQGIPENLKIGYFEITDALKIPTPNETDVVQPQTEPPRMKNDPNTNRIKFDLNDLIMGDIIEVKEIANLSKNELKYDIDEQTADLFDDLISTIPNNQRNSSIINQFNTFVKRFVELRQISSVFDKYGNVEGPIVHDSNDVPLADYLSTFENKLHWIRYGGIISKEQFTGNKDVIKELISDYVKEINNIIKNQVPNAGINKHLNLLKTFIEEMSPLRNVDTSVMSDMFTNKGGYIISRPITGDMAIVNDSEGNMSSSVVFRGKKVNRSFIQQQLNVGTSFLNTTTVKSGRMYGKLEQLTSSDVLNLNSIITLPEPFVRFSRVSLPNTNLLVKTNLSLNFFNYWEYLNKNLKIEQVEIDSLVLDKNDSLSENYLNNTKKFIMNLTEYDKPDDISDLDIFKEIIKIITPRTSVLFELIKKYIDGPLSPQSAMSYLEPFMIYSSHLTFKQYESIARFVNETITKYNGNFSTYENIFNYVRSTVGDNKYSNKLFNLLNDWRPQPINIEPEVIIEEPTTDWEQLRSEKYNADYWYNKKTRESIWTKPEEFRQYEKLKEQVEKERKERKSRTDKQSFIKEESKPNPFNLYGLNSTDIPTSEFLKQIISKDYGALFNALIAQTNAELMLPKPISDSLQNELSSVIGKSMKPSPQCSNYVIAKKYYSLNRLNEDNGKDIYFDKQFDKTNYDIIGDKFEKQKNSMDKDELIEFLTPELKKMYNLSDENAIYLAETLADGVKRVLDGHYAVLSIEDTNYAGMQKMMYYKRDKNAWHETKDIGNTEDDEFIYNSDLLCDLNADCIYDATATVKCSGNSETKRGIVKKQLEGIVNQFDKKYIKSMEEMNQLIQHKILFYENKFKVLEKYNYSNFLQYNDLYYKLGQNISDEDLNIVVSPYYKLRDMILGQSDFSKKQQTIILFANKYCHQGISQTINPITNTNENEWIMYCNETHVPLLPYFRYELAKAFVERPHEYEDVLASLIKTIGKKSDDGNSWVDKNTGEVLCEIDMDFTEGFTDGFVNKTRDIIQTDAEEMIVQNMTDATDAMNRKKMPLDQHTLNVRKIVSEIESQIGVRLEQNEEFIERIVYNTLNNSNGSEIYLFSESKYKELIEKKERERGQSKDAKTGKMPPYSVYYSKKILCLTVGLFAISLQTSIPEVKTRKVLGGCSKSFTGYPMGEPTDTSFIKYLSCALKHLRSSEVPWQGVNKEENAMAIEIMKTYDEILLNNTEIKQRILKKLEYMQDKKNNIPDEYNIIRWTTFLPPLRPTNIKSSNSTNLSSGFYAELDNLLRSGDVTIKQHDKINTIKSKIIYQSLAIQESIQHVVESKQLIMKSNMYYMENSCCNELSNKHMTPLQYFSEASPEIESYIYQIKQMSAYLKSLKYLTNATMVGSKLNSRRKFPAIPNVFSEETIYLAFITYCKYNTTGALGKELLDICINKPSFSGKGKSIQEQIFQLKKDGRNYEQKDLLKLYQTVSKNNILFENVSNSNNIGDELANVLDNLNSRKKSAIVSEDFIEKYWLLMDGNNFYNLIDDDTDSMVDLKNVLENENDRMVENLGDFIAKCKDSGDVKKTSAFLKNLRYTRWDFNKGSIRQTFSNDKLNNYVNYANNFVDLFCQTIPHALINNRHIVTIPKPYWKLNGNHEDMIRNATEKYYTVLNPFYKNDDLLNILGVISKTTKYISKLSKLSICTNNINKNGAIYKKYIDEEICYLMSEYYMLCVFMAYIKVFKSVVEMNDSDGSMGMEHSLGKTLSELFVVYIKMMVDGKKIVDINYESVSDNMFELKELEKILFTDKLKHSTQDQRNIDNFNKQYKLGIYSLGESKALREYDVDQFEQDKQLYESMANLKKKQGRDDIDAEDVDENVANKRIEDEEAEERNMNTNMGEDYYDGDPYGEERDENDYD